jgi:hypothetical protein
VEVSAAAVSISKIQRLETSEQETEDETKTEDLAKSAEGSGNDNESLETASNQSSQGPLKDGLENEFDKEMLGMPADASAADIKAAIAKGTAALAKQSEQAQRIEQLEASLLVASGQPPAPAPAGQQLTTIVSDMSNFHVTMDRVNAAGFARLREKCESELRAKRALDRNLLISTDAQKLIGQMLGAKRVPEFAQWKSWTDIAFFEAMSKIYPAGKAQNLRQL